MARFQAYLYGGEICPEDAVIDVACITANMPSCIAACACMLLAQKSLS